MDLWGSLRHRNRKRRDTAHYRCTRQNGFTSSTNLSKRCVQLRRFDTITVTSAGLTNVNLVPTSTFANLRPTHTADVGHQHPRYQATTAFPEPQ